MIQRLNAPKKGDKWYSTQNPFAGGNYDMFDKHKTKQGNCTHYCYGRASEVLGKKSGMPTYNADNWYAKTKKPKGQTPKQGAVICYKHKNKSGGHVAFIEDMANDKSWLDLSMSGWNSFLFKRVRVYAKDNYCYSDYKLIGFIYTIDEKPVSKVYELLFDKWLRKEPKVAVNKIEKIKKGTRITSIDNKIYTDNKGNKWVYTSVNGKKGYLCIEDSTGIQAKEV